MKIFLAAAAFYVVAVALTGFVSERVSYSATNAFSADGVRVGHESPVDGRLGWSPDL